MFAATVSTALFSVLFTSSSLLPFVNAQYPTLVEQAGAFSYAGCYVSSSLASDTIPSGNSVDVANGCNFRPQEELASSRALVEASYIGDDVTVDFCASFCSSYTFMGVQFGSECYCGNSVQQESEPVSTESGLRCDDPQYACSGDPSQFCGGARAYALYAKPGATTRPAPTGTGFNYVQDSTIVPSAGEYGYIGCYNDLSASNRALEQGISYQDPGMTVEACAAFCGGYTYMGLEGGNECYCGNALNGESKLAPCQDECYQCCAGAIGDRCGGYFRLSLYEVSAPAYVSESYTNTGVCTYNGPATVTVIPVTTTGTVVSRTSTIPLPNQHTVTPSPKPSVGSCSYVGCYSDQDGGRALAFRQDQLAGSNMTIEACLNACVSGGYAFAGLEYGSECYCDAAISNTQSPIVAGDSRGLTCSDPFYRCTGDPAEQCGGFTAIDVYSCQRLSVTATLTSAPTSTRPTTQVSSSSMSMSMPMSMSMSTSTSTSTSTSSACTPRLRKRVVPL